MEFLTEWKTTLTSTEQLFIESFTDISCIMITYPISSSFCEKVICNVISFTIFHGGVLLEKVILEISQNSQENTCGNVYFLMKLQADLSCVFFWRFLVYFISTEKWNEKREIPWQNSSIDLFLIIDYWVLISKKTWQMVIWSEIVFKWNSKLQFSWLEEFH